MALASVKSRALLGVQAIKVVVEVHLMNGLPSFTLVGLADTEVKEARERVRSAILNCGFDFPTNKRITVNLAPADLPKDSGRFDLPIALGILAASGQIEVSKLENWEFAGELSLSGELRNIRGALATSLALQNEYFRFQNQEINLLLPLENAQEAALANKIKVFGSNHLLEIIQNFINSDKKLKQINPPIFPEQSGILDFSDVKGHFQVKRALEIAASGGHGVLLVGPPGSGKSMLAQRFAGILPPLTQEEIIETATISTLNRNFDSQTLGIRPTRNPHHSASSVALVGGGTPPKPGEITYAHKGVLFLDEFPEFTRSALESLREPLENGKITISRANHSFEFPADFQLIAAMNPCPCGYFGNKKIICKCSALQIQRYQNKLSGPLLDRIDLHIHVPILPTEELLNKTSQETSKIVCQRVIKSRNFAINRQGKINCELKNSEIDKFLVLDKNVKNFLSQVATKLSWSSRSTHRVLKIARTIADMQESENILQNHIAEAVQYRRVLNK